ncbi:MAG TPA: hypothetical protein VMT17_11885 [Anaeromyxobacteraceae bacterium]|nr:hypothetical protein [Anaeromyxobacteraceae bacterium]
MLRSRALWIVCVLAPASALAAPTNPVHALRQQIAALQLDHALNLTQQQAQALLPALQAAQGALQAMTAQRSASQPALVTGLTQAVSDLKATGTVSDSTAQAVQAARGSSAGTLRQDLAACWKQVKQVLSPAQLEALKSVRLGIRTASLTVPDGRKAGPDGRKGARHFRVMRTFVSEPFLALVQARATA